MYIDCHVHCRDFDEAYKETVAHALEVASDSGVSAIFDMPNTRPPIISRATVLERLALAEEADSPVFYGTYIGLTPDPAQIDEAVDTHREFFPKPGARRGVVGLKMFTGKSVGDLSVTDIDDQRKVYGQLVKRGYEGVLVDHCEKESKMNPSIWNPDNPVSHSLARPEIAEFESVADQLRFAYAEGYAVPGKNNGKLHIAHISVPGAVELVGNYKPLMNLSCGATPHHLLVPLEKMAEEGGIMYKVNPALRRLFSQGMLLKQFKEEQIDLLETDHAPHTLEEKTEKFMSRIPNLASWPIFIQLLKKQGVTEAQLDKVAFERVNEIFGTKIPMINLPRKDHTEDEEYAFSPYAHLI